MKNGSHAKGGAEMSDEFERSAVDVRADLLELHGQRTLASFRGLTGPPSMAELDGEIEAATRAYVGAAVTEIATLRAELWGPQVG
jgi:hypothetical protein